MAWFRVDDKLAEHPKVRKIPRSKRRNSMGLWILAGAWCALNTTDGHVPGYMVEDLACKPADARELVRVGLWHEADHECDCAQPRDPDGFIFHHWNDLQPTKAELDAKRAETAERQRQHRARVRAEKEGETEPGHDPVTRDTSVSHAPVDPSRPVPTRPVPKPLSSTERGQRQETLDAAAETMRAEDARCTEHNGIDDPGPCRGCMVARQHAETAIEAAKRERRAARSNCARCGGSGWIETADGAPAAKCDHRPLLEVVNG